MHNFYCAHTFINFLDIYYWTFLLFTAALLFKNLLWEAILCASLSLQVVYSGPYYNLCWMQSRLWVIMCFSHFTDSLWAIFQAQSQVVVLACQISYWQRKKNAPDKCLTFFRSKELFLDRFRAKNYINWKTIGGNSTEPDWSMMCRIPLTKKTQQYLPWIERNEFFKKSTAEFPTLCHPSSRRNILTTIAPNQTRLKPMETRHPKFPRTSSREPCDRKKIKYENLRDK